MELHLKKSKEIKRFISKKMYLRKVEPNSTGECAGLLKKNLKETK